MIEPRKVGYFRHVRENTPSINDPVWASEFYKHLGIMIVAWGRLEGHFVACIIQILGFARDEKELGYKIPPLWEQREALWTKAFANAAAFAPIKDAAMAILADMSELAKDRNAVVHALWEGFNANDLSINIVSLKTTKGTKDGLDFRRGLVSIAILMEMATVANRLNNQLQPVSDFISRLRGPPPPDAEIL